MELKPYLNYKLKRKCDPVTDEDIQTELTAIQNASAELVKVDRPTKEGDVLSINLKVKELKVILGPDGTIDQNFKFDLSGVKNHFTKVFTANKTFMRVEVNEIFEKRTPELNDALAVKCGSKDLADMKAAILIDLQTDRKKVGNEQLKMDLLKMLTEDNKEDALKHPDLPLLRKFEMVKRKLPNAPEPNLKMLAEKLTIQEVIISEIAAKENLTISEEEILNFMQANYSKNFIEGLQKEESAEFRAIALCNKVLDYIIAKSEIEIPKITEINE